MTIVADETIEERRARLVGEAEAMHDARRTHAQAVEARRIGTKALATEGMEAWSQFGDDPRGGVIVEISQTIVEETGEIIRRFTTLNPYQPAHSWECSMPETEVLEDGIRLSQSSRLVKIARRLVEEFAKAKGGVATPRDEKHLRWAHRLLVIAMGGGR